MSRAFRPGSLLPSAELYRVPLFHWPRSKSLYQQPVAVLHQYMSQVAELGLAAFGFLEQLGIRIRCGFVGLILSLFPMKIDLSSRVRCLPLSILAPLHLLPPPSPHPSPAPLQTSIQ